MNPQKEKERYFNKTEVHDFTKKFLDSMTGPEKPINKYEIEVKNGMSERRDSLYEHSNRTAYQCKQYYGINRFEYQ